MRNPDDPGKDRGSQYYPSPERMQEIEEVFRKLGIGTQEERDRILAGRFLGKPHNPQQKCQVTETSNSSGPYIFKD